MAIGWTTTGSLADSLPSIKSSARTTREYVGVMSQLCENHTLGVGIGLSWDEITYASLTAQAVTETTELQNPQQIADSLQAITPTLIGLETFITDRVERRISKIGYAKLGRLGQEAMQRKKDEDGLSIFSTGATTVSPGAGNILTTGHISSAVVNITSNTTQPGAKPIYGVLHGFQIKDIADELVASIGTYNLTDGPTARVFEGGWSLKIADCTIYEDGNIPIDSSTDALGGVFSKEAIVLINGASARIVTVRNEKRGGGGNHVYHYDEYAYGERPSNGYGWVQKIVSDATAPTS